MTSLILHLKCITKTPRKEELKKKAGVNAGPTIDDEIKSLKDYMVARKDTYMYARDDNDHQLVEDFGG